MTIIQRFRYNILKLNMMMLAIKLNLVSYENLNSSIVFSTDSVKGISGAYVTKSERLRRTADFIKQWDSISCMVEPPG